MPSLSPRDTQWCHWFQNLSGLPRHHRHHRHCSMGPHRPLPGVTTYSIHQLYLKYVELQQYIVDMVRRYKTTTYIGTWGEHCMH